MTTTISQNLITPNARIIYDSGEITTAVTTLDIPGLNLAQFESYDIFFNFFNTTGSTCLWQLSANGDTGATGYQVQGTESFGSVISAFRNVFPYIGFAQATHNSIGHGKIMHSANGGLYINTETMTNASGTEHATYYCWKDDVLTVNVTSLKVTASITNGIGIGSRVQIINPLGS